MYIQNIVKMWQTSNGSLAEQNIMMTYAIQCMQYTQTQMIYNVIMNSDSYREIQGLLPKYFC